MEKTPPAPNSNPMPDLWKDGRTNPEWLKWYEQNKPPDLGFGDDFGRAICHGCGNAFEEGVGKHKKNCPRVCTWKVCSFHGRTNV